MLPSPKGFGVVLIDEGICQSRQWMGPCEQVHHRPKLLLSDDGSSVLEDVGRLEELRQSQHRYALWCTLGAG